MISNLACQDNMMALRKKPFMGNKGLDAAKGNLSVDDEGDCPRCGGNSVSSSIQDYLACDRCNYEWKDPNATSGRQIHRDSVSSESQLVKQFQEEFDRLKGRHQLMPKIPSLRPIH